MYKLSFNEYYNNVDNVEYLNKVVSKIYYTTKYHHKLEKIFFSADDFLNACLLDIIQHWNVLDLTRSSYNTFVYMRILSLAKSSLWTAHHQKRKIIMDENIVYLDVENSTESFTTNTDKYDIIEDRKRKNIFGDDDLINSIVEKMEDDKEVTKLFLEGYSYKEIMEIHNLSFGSLKHKINAKIKPKVKIILENLVTEVY